MKKDTKKPEVFPAGVEENLEDIATGVAKISRGMELLRASRLRPKTILLLLSHASGLSQRDVDKVLQAMADLEKQYLK